MKCYFGGSSDMDKDFDFVTACFASDRDEAKRLMWKYGDLSEDCDGDYMNARVIRRPEHDSLFGKDGKKDAHVVRDQALLREMGWMMEGDERCSWCGLATMDGEYPLCQDCETCSDCGHEHDCESRLGQENSDE